MDNHQLHFIISKLSTIIMHTTNYIFCTRNDPLCYPELLPYRYPHFFLPFYSIYQESLLTLFRLPLLYSIVISIERSSKQNNFPLKINERPFYCDRCNQESEELPESISLRRVAW